MPSIQTERQRAKRWIKTFYSSYDHGISGYGPAAFGPDGKKRIRRQTNDKIVAKINRRFFSEINYKTIELDRHFDRDTTFYASAVAYSKKSDRYIATVTIDIDCKKKGSAAGAEAFAEYLAENYFPNLYHEVSTGGVGRACYLQIDFGRYGCGRSNLRDFAKQLGESLNRIATEEGFDIEHVEIMGLPVEIQWSKTGSIERYTGGVLTKVPRDISRVSEWENTARITWEQCIRLPWINAAAKTEKQKSEKQNNSSISGCGLTNREIEALPAFTEYARKVLAGEVIEVGNTRQIITEEDMGLFLAIVYSKSIRPNKDGSMPVAYAEHVWKSVTDRGWSRSRWAAMRKFAEEKGFVVVKDARYIIGTGAYKGQAAKWGLSKEAVEIFKALVGSCTGVRGTTTSCVEQLSLPAPSRLPATDLVWIIPFGTPQAVREFDWERDITLRKAG